MSDVHSISGNKQT